MANPPERIYTERLVLRRWKSGDAQVLKSAIDSSLLHLQEWMPWAMQEPTELSVIKHRLEKFEESFAAGREWLYGIFDRASDSSVIISDIPEREPLGGIGLHPRIEPGGLEIGYWLRADQMGHGFVTEATKALARVGVVDLGASWIEIRCDPSNSRSAAIPKRLGFRHTITLERNTLTPTGAPLDTLAAFRAGNEKPHFAEIDVERMNVVEEDGRVRMVISNTDRAPGWTFRGKVIPGRPKNAGMIILQ